MSGAPELADPAADLVLDPGVLASVATLEFHGFQAVAAVGGVAVLPWRLHARAAAAAGVASVPKIGSEGGFAQAVVRIGKGRAATEADLAAAWSALAPDGRLLLVGQNEVGITTWAKRVAQAVGVAGEVLANRAHGRVVAFPRTSVRLPAPAATSVALPDGRLLRVDPGVFSGDGLDVGTAALIAVLPAVCAELPTAPLIADVGCGAGHLAAAAQAQCPAARLLLLDADARAVASAQANLPTATCAWWDDQDSWPGAPVDLALLNPPCHRGTATDLSIARRLFQVIPARWLLVVANRQLAYEADLAALGDVTRIADDGRFKILSLTRSSPAHV
jgi:16S rRNA (guanine1207-N2)-methyltransferase